jgi:hypothetical protein
MAGWLLPWPAAGKCQTKTLSELAAGSDVFTMHPRCYDITTYKLLCADWLQVTRAQLKR